MKPWPLLACFMFFSGYAAHANTFEISLLAVGATTISSEFEVLLPPDSSESISSHFEISLPSVAARTMSFSFLITIPDVSAKFVQSVFLITLPGISASSIQSDFLISLSKLQARVVDVSIQQQPRNNDEVNGEDVENGNVSTLGSAIQKYGPWCDQLANFMIEQNRKALGDQFDLAFGGKDTATIKKEYIEDAGYSDQTCQKLMQAIANAK